MDNSLIQEMMSYANNLRAEMIYLKCLRAGRLKWAENIQKKYNVGSKQHYLKIGSEHAMVYSKN